MTAADRDTALAHLRRRGFRLPGDSQMTVLGGGVSNVVLCVSGGGERLVLKQPLARLRVADDWRAPVERLLAECDALRIAGRLTPQAVPAVRDCDEQDYLLVMEHAPAGWLNWKEQLLAGEIDRAVAVRLAEVLATWHSATAGGALATARLRRTDIFAALRLDPYYGAAAARLPEFADQLNESARALAASRDCLIHGDFSPKNVLTGPPGELWVVDFEVACLGDPAFDLAFMLAHLLLKGLHRPARAADYDAALDGFCAAYQTTVTAALKPDWARVVRQTGCLLVARVLGKSPAEYLTTRQQRRALNLGTAILTEQPGSLGDLLAARSHQ